MDEGRHETLYELEIAFAELERVTRAGDERPPPWLVDRLLRHLLTDITGNTHRSEFCIDKLYSPDTDRGRLGLLELRGFEMPPHPRMALVQALLVRALVARFWDGALHRSTGSLGHRLHDRFLLPGVRDGRPRDVVRDSTTCSATARSSTRLARPVPGVPLPAARRDHGRRGRARAARAIEPWHVLGEEVSLGGTSRYVDSSVERVQVDRHGSGRGPPRDHLQRGPDPAAGRSADPGRRASAGGPLPGLGAVLRPAPDHRRALPAGLRPGRHLEQPLAGWLHLPRGAPRRTQLRHHPVNAIEAEARRASRFEALGHTSGRVEIGALRPIRAWSIPPLWTFGASCRAILARVPQ